MKQFPQVLKGSATATAKNPARTGYTGPRAKPITLPSLESLKILLEDKQEEKKENDKRQ